LVCNGAQTRDLRSVENALDDREAVILDRVRHVSPLGPLPRKYSKMARFGVAHAGDSAY
jgi:hypothetical protein